MLRIKCSGRSVRATYEEAEQKIPLEMVTPSGPPGEYTPFWRKK